MPWLKSSAGEDAGAFASNSGVFRNWPIGPNHCFLLSILLGAGWVGRNV
jgi:hypothetical protein